MRSFTLPCIVAVWFGFLAQSPKGCSVFGHALVDVTALDQVSQ